MRAQKRDLQKEREAVDLARAELLALQKQMDDANAQKRALLDRVAAVYYHHSLCSVVQSSLDSMNNPCCIDESR
jgi:hypothetical protein